MGHAPRRYRRARRSRAASEPGAPSNTRVSWLNCTHLPPAEATGVRAAFAGPPGRSLARTRQHPPEEPDGPNGRSHEQEAARAPLPLQDRIAIVGAGFAPQGGSRGRLYIDADHAVILEAALAQLLVECRPRGTRVLTDDAGHLQGGAILGHGSDPTAAVPVLRCMAVEPDTCLATLWILPR